MTRLTILIGFACLLPREAFPQPVATDQAIERYISCVCAEAVPPIEAAAQQGNAKAQRYMGMAFEEGTAVKQSLTRAVSWYKRAAAAGDHVAVTRLGSLYRRLGQEEDAVRILQPEIKGPASGEAFYELAHVEAAPGRTTPPDLAKARALYALAAKAGYLPGARELGLMLVKGLGGDTNKKEGTDLLELAAKGGDAEAALVLGDLERDSENRMSAGILAPAWYERAARDGRPEGFLRAAAMFEQGRIRGLAGSGYSPNYQRIMGWYGKAAQSKDFGVVLKARNKQIEIERARDREAKSGGLHDIAELRLDASGVTLRDDPEDQRAGLRMCLKSDGPAARIASVTNQCSIGLGNLRQGELISSSCEWVAAGWSYFEPGQCKWVRTGALGYIDLAVEYKRNDKWEPGIFSDQKLERDCGSSRADFLVFSEKRMGSACLGEVIMYNYRVQLPSKTNFKLDF